MGRGPRMDPGVYYALKEKIQSLDGTATRITISEGTSSTTMRNRIVRVATELGIPVTVRKVRGGLLFWDLQEGSFHETAGLCQADLSPDSLRLPSVDVVHSQCPYL
jgi:hypothetical protein